MSRKPDELLQPTKSAGHHIVSGLAVTAPIIVDHLDGDCDRHRTLDQDGPPKMPKMAPTKHVIAVYKGQ